MEMKIESRIIDTKETSLDFNNIKPCFDLLQLSYNFISLIQKDIQF